ncbi:unnamed protein product [Notodromas monacha]|uniref:Uncharacterized protein n=1 Tax=Notodromas monacha TaxID=399045 RepID=A0A7R9BSI7_9CRUS|nr:unnamed protein product [Notodromas monacha]CAG0920918.1 unnamed protein product [Notodromas monacha]
MSTRGAVIESDETGKQSNAHRSELRPDARRDDTERKIFGIPTRTRSGEPKDAVVLLNEVTMKRLPPVKLLLYKQDADSIVALCIVGNKIVEARGKPKEARLSAINEMLSKLSHHCESGYASENPHSPSSNSQQVHDSSVEETKDEQDRPRAKSSWGKLMSLAREMLPPVKYDVRVVRRSTGPLFITRCRVKHFVTYGEAAGVNGKRKSKITAAEAMLERLKTLPPMVVDLDVDLVNHLIKSYFVFSQGSEEEDYHLINAPISRAITERSVPSRKEVKRDKIIFNRLSMNFLREMVKDNFFEDHFVKAFLGGSFFDQVELGRDYEVLLVLWHSPNLMPMDTIASGSPKLRMIRPDSFADALSCMEFLGDRGFVLPSKVLDWFNGLAQHSSQNCVLPPGMKVRGSTVDGTFVLKITDEDVEFSVKLKPCFMFPSLTRLPACTVDLKYLSKVLDSEWYMVPERVMAVQGQSAKRQTHWTIVAPAGEREIFHDTQCCKPLLRLFYDLNETEGWKLPLSALKNMFIDEVLLHNEFEFWNFADCASLFIMMLSKLESCLESGHFPTVWESSELKIAEVLSVPTLKKVLKLRSSCLSCYRRAAQFSDPPRNAEFLQELYSLLASSKKKARLGKKIAHE